MNQKKHNKKLSPRYNLSSLNDNIKKWNNSKTSSQKTKQINKDIKHDNKIDTGHEYLPWYQKYKPNDIIAIALHKQKLKCVEEYVDSMINGEDSKRILLLTGPSGCSKSTVIKILANNLIPKYRSFNGSDSLKLSSDEKVDFIEYYSDLSINGLNQMDSFREFLNQSRYKTGSNLSLILVEDLPNVFHDDTRKAFQSVLLEWLFSPERKLPPLVICLTECEIESDSSRPSSFSVDQMYTAETILGREILNHPSLKRIKFNPVNMTLTKKTLNRIANFENEIIIKNGKWKQRIEYINKLSLSCGDIRSSICALEFWATSNSNLEFATRPQSTSYFHAIGKIIYGSKETTDDNEMINSLISSTKGLVNNENFKLGLLENYESFNGRQFDIKTAYKITDTLSESDHKRFIDEDLEYATRQVRYTFRQLKNDNHHHGQANFPLDWKIRRLMNEFIVQGENYYNIEFYKYHSSPLMKNIISSYAYYGPLIRKNRQYKKKVMNHYLQALSKRQSDEKLVLNKDIFVVDDSIDIMERIGGSLSSSISDRSIIGTDEVEKEDKKSLERLQEDKRTKLLKLIKQNEFYSEGLETINDEDKEMLDDFIVDSDETNDNIDNDEDDSFFEMLSQRKPKIKPTVDESLSDSDLEML